MFGLFLIILQFRDTEFHLVQWGILLYISRSRCLDQPYVVQSHPRACRFDSTGHVAPSPNRRQRMVIFSHPKANLAALGQNHLPLPHAPSFISTLQSVRFVPSTVMFNICPSSIMTLDLRDSLCNWGFYGKGLGSGSPKQDTCPDMQIRVNSGEKQIMVIIHCGLVGKMSRCSDPKFVFTVPL